MPGGNNITSFEYWFTNRTIKDKDSFPGLVSGIRELDLPLKDGRLMWAASYGECPVESPYVGTVGKFITNHIHLDDGRVMESYISTTEGEVIKVITDLDTGELHEGPTTLTESEVLNIITFLEDQLLPAV